MIMLLFAVLALDALSSGCTFQLFLQSCRDELDALSSGSNGDANGDADAVEGLSSDHEGFEVEVPVDPDAKLEVVRKVKQAFGNANNTRHRSNLKRTVLRAGLKRNQCEPNRKR